MDLSNLAMVTDPDALAAHAVDLDEAAEELHAALSRLNNAFLEYADRIWPDEQTAEEARADLLTLRADLSAAQAEVDRLTATTPVQEQAQPLNEQSAEPPTHPDAYNGWTNFETWSVHLWLSNDPYTDATAREIVATAWNNAADEITADRTAIVAPRADAADALRDWLLDEENPLAESSNLYGDLLEHALGRVDWLELAEAFEPDPLPSLEPPSDDDSDDDSEEQEEGEEEPQETDPADIEPGYLSPDDIERLRRARGNRRFFH